MKTKLVLIAFFSLLFGDLVTAQPKTVTPLIGFDNYTIPLNKKGAVIGKLLYKSDNKKVKISLLKDTSDLFRINRKGVLSLKRRALVTAESLPFRYEISLTINGQAKTFELVKDQFINNQVVAHRGAWKNHGASQNSLSSLKNAIALGCIASELDVWMSEDGQVVVCHDPTVGGKSIEQTTAAELTKIPLKNNDFVPTLREYLLTVKSQNKTRLYLEIKSSLVSQERTLELTEKVVNLVHELNAQAWVNYISFNFGSLLRVMELDPAAKTAYVSDDKTVKEVADAKMWSIDFNGKMYQNDPSLIKQAHDRGLVVNVWTINDPEQMKAFLEAGVDVITTNEPEILMELVKKK
jgi:glycerophosphoryl diester phosphodiesterase